MKEELVAKIKAMGPSAGRRWMDVATSAMEGNQDACAACAELAGQKQQNRESLLSILRAAYQTLSMDEKMENYARAEQDLRAQKSEEDDATERLADRLVSLRKARGMTQKELALAAEMPLVSLQKLENGTNKLLRVQVRTCIALARALGVSVEELVGEENIV